MPVSDPAAQRPAAAAEIANLADRNSTEMISIFRALFLESSAAASEVSPWANPALRGLGLLQIPETLLARRDYETLFAFARSERFLQAQADEFPRSRPGSPCADPVRTLDQALSHARELDRVPEMAAFTLSRARWGSRMAIWTPLTALQLGHQDLACTLADSRPAEQLAFWYLLMAWHRYEAGSRDGAHQLLSRLLPKKLPRMEAQDGRHVVVLLRHAAEISPEAFNDLQQRLLDDNDRTDLCRELIKAGQLEVVPTVAATIQLCVGNRIPVLAAAAKAAMATGQPGLAAMATSQAAETLRLIAADAQANNIAADLAENLARIAGAQAACGDFDGARRGFAQAIEACGGASAAGHFGPAVRAIAVEQAAAGLLDDAERTITRITDEYLQGEALRALAVARARAGQAAAAERTLDETEPGLYLDYPHAVREVACALATAGQPGPGGELARRRLRPQEHMDALAAVAVAIGEAGDVVQAMTLADSIAEFGWRARALTSIARLADGAWHSAETARRAVEGLPDPGLQAELLAELATTDGCSAHLDQALLLAGTLNGEQRWHALLAIGVAQLTADPAAAPATFASIREIIRNTESDPWFWTDELWQVGMTQANAGDTAGARQTFAEMLSGPVTDPGSWLRPVTIARIAANQARTGQTKAALRGCRLARQQAAAVRGQWQAVAYRAIAAAQVAAGALDAAADTVRAVLGIAETAAGDDDEDTVAEAIEQGVHAAVHVARELSRADRPKKARHLLSDSVSKAREWSERSMLGYADMVGELACVLAELGKNRKAAEVAAWDPTGMASGQLCTVIARRLADSGDLDGALGVTRLIQDPRISAAAYGAVAKVLTSRNEHGATRTLLADAAGRFRVARPGTLAVAALLEIAAAQAAARCTDDIAATLALARQAASGLDRADDRDQALSQIAQSWALHGDPERAVELAADIGNADRAGEALVTAALAIVAHDRANRAAATAIIDSAVSPGWLAIGLTVVGMTGPDGHGTDARRYFAEVDQLVNHVPEGEPRARVQRGIIEVALASGDYEIALRVARSVTVGRKHVLSDLVGELAAQGAPDAVKSMLTDCAQQTEPAYAACIALAQAFPDQVGAILNEVAVPV
jgi:hypothetical protein